MEKKKYSFAGALVILHTMRWCSYAWEDMKAIILVSWTDNPISSTNNPLIMCLFHVKNYFGIGEREEGNWGRGRLSLNRERK